MPLTDVEIELIRDEIGTSTPPEDSDLDDIFERKGTWQATAVVILKRRLADMLSTPAQFTVPGEYSQGTGPNITALQAKISRLEAASAPAADTGLPVVEVMLPEPAPPR